MIDLVDQYVMKQPDQWIQLVGNHEAQYLRAPAFEWPETIDRAAAGTLRRWWAEGHMVAAVSVSTHDECFLITHAGLTSGFWDVIWRTRIPAADRRALYSDRRAALRHVRPPAPRPLSASAEVREA